MIGHARCASINQKLYNCVIAREHVFRVMKCQFGYRKVRYRGIDRNGAKVFALLALANLFLARRTLASARRQRAAKAARKPSINR